MPLHCDNSVTKRSRTYDSSWHYSLEVIALFIIALLNDNDVFAYVYIYHLEHTTISFKCLVNEHVFMNSISLTNVFSPH